VLSKRTEGAMRIDVHAHYWTEGYLDLLADLGKADAGAARGLGAGGGAELAARLALMDRAGVQMQVLSACPQTPYGGDATKAAGAARFVNDQYAELVEHRPDHLARTGSSSEPTSPTKTATHSSARSITSTTRRSTRPPPGPSSTRTPAACSSSDRNPREPPAPRCHARLRRPLFPPIR
jgi:hypothetical protein